MKFQLAERLTAYGERTCVLFGDGQRASYGDLLELARRIYDTVGPDRNLIFIIGDNAPATLAAYMGAMRYGHAVHLMDPQRGRENAALIERYTPGWVIECDGMDWTLRRTSDAPPDLHPELFLLLSTSGSTGSGKMVKLSYGNVDSNTAAITDYLGLTGEDCAATLLRPCYSYGLSVINTHLYTGARLLLSNRSVHDRTLWQRMAAARVTNLSGVPNTFETLDQLAPDWARLPDLRLMTQAGGALAPALIRKYAVLGRRFGWEFYVMYGQTEASPRISYLPPELTESHAGSIGRAIPGGELLLRDRQGRVIEGDGVEGELVYRGPNVMMGYAESAAELARSDRPAELSTGDLAIRSPEGLFTLKGRLSRFVKILGLRVNLDDIETHLSEAGPAAVVGTDSRIGVFVTAEEDPDALVHQLARRYALPEACFMVYPGAVLPRLSSGKTDYRALAANLEVDLHPPESSAPDRLRRFFGLIPGEFAALLLGTIRHVPDVRESFEHVFPQRSLGPTDSFNSIGGDSMDFVQIEIGLEDHLGWLPENWPGMSIAELEALKEPEVV